MNKIRFEDEAFQKISILIARRHLSGTSAITRVINLFGDNIAFSLLQPPSDNLTRNWESIELYLFHKKLLKSLNMSWDNVLTIPDIWSNYIDSLNWVKNYIKSEFTQYDSCIMKDSRLSRFLLLWIETFQNLKFDIKVVVPFRNWKRFLRSKAKLYCV